MKSLVLVNAKLCLKLEERDEELCICIVTVMDWRILWCGSGKFEGSFSHGFTYSGILYHVFVALEAIKIYKERNIIEQVKSISPILQDGIKAFSNSPIIGEFCDLGLVVGVSLQTINHVVIYFHQSG
ncbi:hypothetical protein Sjap_008260 [Stephania japonica]|uniref:Uncharacterized protein n=1 Tax=Stephania japonica TaxID=461633 RepID=A0AAP0PEA5_9MAGN